MAGTFSRRKLADHVATQLFDGQDTVQLAQQVVAYLVDEKRTGQLELLIRDIEDVLARRYNVAVTRITSARSLEDTTRDALLEFVRQAESVREAILAEETVDESLIGGVVLETPGGVFDSSIRTALRQLQATTKE